MNEIVCQRCIGVPDKDGCATCGGYRVVLSHVACPNCSQLYWTRPGHHTIYVGKEWVSYDGLKLINTKDGIMCAECKMKSIE